MVSAGFPPGQVLSIRDSKNPSLGHPQISETDEEQVIVFQQCLVVMPPLQHLYMSISTREINGVLPGGVIHVAIVSETVQNFKVTVRTGPVHCVMIYPAVIQSTLLPPIDV